MDYKEPQEAPPPYSEDPPDLMTVFSSLDLEGTSPKPTVDQCLVHLKLLKAFCRLRKEIGTKDGLYGIRDSFVSADLTEEKKAEISARIREKRWATYVTNACLRFERWWNLCILPHTVMLRKEDVEAASFADITKSRAPLGFSQDNLPPLDVIMVWHSYMLNPRKFLEDSIRYGAMHFWGPLPWKAIDASIYQGSFLFETSEKGRWRFQRRTGLAWDSPSSASVAGLQCPRCSKEVDLPLTTCTSDVHWSAHNAGEKGFGFGDPGFRTECRFCSLQIDHDLLKTQKFRNDVQRLLEETVPMPGTVLNTEGIPQLPTRMLGRLLESEVSYSNRLISEKVVGQAKTLGRSILDATDLRKSSIPVSINDIRNLIETALTYKFTQPTRKEKIAIRRMMSSYWENSSMFSIDLVGAVIRQGSFIEKMHSIDWIGSPVAIPIMDKLIQKYERYVDILAKHPGHVAVPTLDVDLAWHTHQLNPRSYYDYSIAKTSSFIDHDDKIEENRLSNAFEWTSKTYQKMFNEVYSECLCWYCAAVRESHTSTISRLFKPNKDAVSMKLDELRTTSSDNPYKHPHISAHNSIRPITDVTLTKAAELEKHYQKACKRAKKQGQDPPNRSRDVSFNDAWGYPIYTPYYAPYMGDLSVNEEMYTSNPKCANFTTGGAGNCCQGTCGGGVAAGACAGNRVGACAGGIAGGCSNSSGGFGTSGSCGGGGFGCGGGGGGCGGGG